MTKKPLTDLEIKKLKPPETGRIEVPDGRLPGLSLRVTKRSVKTFALRTRVHGKMIRVTLGQYPELSLADARARAFGIIADAKNGIRPQLKTTRVDPSNKFDAVVDDYLQLHCRRFMKPRTLEETKRILQVEFVQHWHERDIQHIAKQDVIAIVNDIFKRPQLDAKKRIAKTDSPSAANHAFGIIRAFFNWCVGQGKLDLSPCTALRSPAPKRKRDRVLEDQEIISVWHAATEIGYPYGSIIKLLIATVQRRSEVAALRWNMLRLEEKIWRVPADENKSGREYLVPLSPLALGILQDTPETDPTLIFPAQRSDGKVFADWSKSKKRIDALSGVTDWTVHDLRRTGSTNLAKLGVAPHVKERILNHVTGELGGVAGVYDIYSYLPEKREALDLWSNYLTKLTT